MGKTAFTCSTSSADGTTLSRCQALSVPTSMNSMKRTMCPVPLKWRTMSSTVWSFTPRSTTALILMGSNPARSAAAMPSSTASGV